MGTDAREKFSAWWVSGLDLPALDENHLDNTMQTDVSLYKSGAEFLSPLLKKRRAHMRGLQHGLVLSFLLCRLLLRLRASLSWLVYYCISILRDNQVGGWWILINNYWLVVDGSIIKIIRSIKRGYNVVVVVTVTVVISKKSPPPPPKLILRNINMLLLLLLLL